MAWVRIHDGAMTHPKVLGLSDRAFRLWVWGLTYAQQHLTNGWLPTLAIPGALAKSVKDLVAAALWEAVANGYQVHDYLDWNDSRETVTKKRSEAKERMSAARVRSLSVRANEHTNNPRTSPEVLRGLVSSSSGSSLERERERKPLPPMNGTLDDVIAERAGRFCDRYAELYQQHRRGARYLPKPALDFPKACDLCAVWDSDRLERLAIVFLKCEEPFAQSGSRTIGQFAAMASWADGRLAEVEATA
jgi:hypothetical protein